MKPGFLALVLVLGCGVALAQTGGITGIVTDPTGAAIPSVQLTVVHTATSTRSTAQTNADGDYAVPSLRPGTYTVTARHEGFKLLARTGIELLVGQELRLDLHMELGAVSDQVSVQAEAAILDTETAAAGQVIQSKQILELPLLGRNPYALGALVPGVRVARGVNDLPVDQISTASVSINGQRGNQNEYLLDGAPNTGGAQNQPIIYANPDAVQEFKVEIE